MQRALQELTPEPALEVQCQIPLTACSRHELKLLGAQRRLLDQESAFFKTLFVHTEEIIDQFQKLYPALEGTGNGIRRINDLVRHIKRELWTMRKNEAADLPSALPLPDEGSAEASLLEENMRKVSANHPYFSLVDLYRVLHSNVYRLLQKIGLDHPTRLPYLKLMLAFLQSSDEKLRNVRSFLGRPVRFHGVLCLRSPRQQWGMRCLAPVARTAPCAQLSPLPGAALFQAGQKAIGVLCDWRHG